MRPRSRRPPSRRCWSIARSAARTSPTARPWTPTARRPLKQSSWPPRSRSPRPSRWPIPAALSSR
ncbi:MAG: hypothetical protein C0481_19445 [Phenylobacterium sp.]|nr:hypothetical protein [Phenylobacterium sp.]